MGYNSQTPPPRYHPFNDGVIAADGTEQIIAEYPTPGVVILCGWVDLSALQGGETVRIREYVRLTDLGGFKVYAASDYSGVMDDPMLYIESKPSNRGIMLTVEQIAGVLRQFPFQTFIKS